MTAPRRVLVTGARGFIGTHLMDLFERRGVPAVGLDLRGDGDGDGDGGRVVAADVADLDSYRDVLATCDVVVHTAALVSNAMADADMWRVNVLATRDLVAAATRCGVRRFVHISSIVAYGNTATGELDEDYPVHADGGSYVRTKLASEHVVLAAHARGDVEVVVVRPGDVYGPGCRVWVDVPLQMIKARQFFLPARGRGCFRPVYVGDLVAGVALAATTPEAGGNIFNLSSDGYVSTRDFFAYHHRWLGRRGPLCLPTWLALAIAEPAFRVQLLAGIRSEGSGASVRQLTSRAWFSNAKAAAVLGWAPVVGLDDGMARTEAWARDSGLI